MTTPGSQSMAARLWALSAPRRLWAAAGVIGVVTVYGMNDQIARAKDPIRILALGDSLMAGYRLAPGQAVPDRLAHRLRAKGYTIEIVNGSVSGGTSAGGVSRLEWVSTPKPDIAVVALGGNDALRGLSPQDTRANLARIVERLKEKGVAVLLAGMIAPPNLGAEYGDAFNRIYPELAESMTVSLYPFILEGVAGRADLLQSDGMHPNAAGTALMAEKMFPFLEPLAREARGRPGP